MQIVDIEVENLYIFWTTLENSMKFSGDFWLMIILKTTKKQGFTLFSGNKFFEKPQEGSNWPTSLFRVNIYKYDLNMVNEFFGEETGCTMFLLWRIATTCSWPPLKLNL